MATTFVKEAAIPFIQTKSGYVARDNAYLDTSKQRQERYSALGSGSGALFVNGANVDYIVRGSRLGQVDSWCIQMNITNNNIAACTLVNLMYLIDYIQVSVNSSQFNIYPEQIYQHLKFEDTEETSIHSQYSNWSPATYESASTGSGDIAAGATQTLFLEIPNIFTLTPIPICLINQDIKMTVYLRSGTSIFDSTSAHTTASDISIDMTNLYLSGRMFSRDQMAAVMKAQQSGGIKYNTFTVERSIISLGVLATGTDVSQNLSSFNGYYHSLSAFIRAAGAQQERLYQYVTGVSVPNDLFQLTNVDLNDGTGSPYYSVINRPNLYVRYVLEKQRYKSLFPTVSAYYDLSFCPDISEVAVEGGSVGLNPIDNTWTLNFRTVNSGGTNCELVVLGHQWVVAGVDPNGCFIYRPQGKNTVL